MSFEITGKLHKKFDTEQKTEKFKAREFVIIVEESNYPQYIKFQLTQDRCDLIDEFEEGQMMKVSFDLQGRQWQDKYFTNLNAWRVGQPDAVTDAKGGEQGFPDDPFPSESFPNAKDAPAKDDFDDLPF